MSDPLRIALVAEGLTDAVVIEAALCSMLGGRAFVLKQVFPEDSATFGPMGTGWVGGLESARQQLSVRPFGFRRSSSRQCPQLRCQPCDFP
jgi:hypothetical protein